MIENKFKGSKGVLSLYLNCLKDENLLYGFKIISGVGIIATDGRNNVMYYISRGMQIVSVDYE